MTHRFRPPARLAGVAVLSTLILAAAGCDKPTGVVTGKVTVGGKPVPRGLITFVSDAGNKDAFSAAIVDGEYRTSPIPVGTCKVTVRVVTPPGEEPKEAPAGQLGGAEAVDRPAAAPGPRGKAKDKGAVAINPKYGATDSSGLSVVVEKGETKYDVTLDP